MRTPMPWALPLTLVLVLTVAARGDEPIQPTATTSEANPAVPAFGHSVHGEAFNDGPRQEAVLLPGMGTVRFPVTTTSPEAQDFVTQGVAQLHSFYYLEAERSFRQAARLDPGCVMAYWGMAMANVNNEKRARGFLAEARKAAKDAPELTRRERLYLDAMAARYRDGADAKRRRRGHLEGLEDLVDEFPDDLDAKAWLAMVTWQNSGQDGIGSRKAVDTLLEEVLRAEPLHPGAHHYRIHLWDDIRPRRALTSAAVYSNTAPGIAHAWHMPGHTYTSLHRYADAAYHQEGSARVDHAAMARDRIMPFEIHNYAHNNQWLATSLSHVGRAREAIAVARNLVEQPRDPEKNGPNDGGSPQRSGRARWAEVLVRYELWDDLIAANASGALDWSDVPQERKEKAYTLGLAHAAKGDGGKLSEQIAALNTLAEEEAKKAKEPAKDHDPFGVQPALAELEGHEKLLEGDTGAAFERFEEARAMRPEALARAHLAARNFGLAEAAAKRGVDRHPGEVPPLAAYVEVLHAVGKDDEARRAYARLLPLARRADGDLPVFRRLAAIAQQWKDHGWTPPAEVDEPTDDAEANRIDLTSLGPLTWAPYPAVPFTRDDTKGQPWSLGDRRGKKAILLFYLGGRCPHCMQQLQVFGEEIGALRELGVELVAISTDDAAATRTLKENDEGVKFPMPLLADPGLELFHAYRCFDDFEDQPLHGAFLIDGDGAVRFQRIGADPFLDVKFLKQEAARLDRIGR